VIEISLRIAASVGVTSSTSVTTEALPSTLKCDLVIDLPPFGCFDLGFSSP
jgi:hypothetical protein